MSLAHSAELWWERGADKWYYKDDWKGLALQGARAFTRTYEVPDGAVSGWIVIWGRRGYALKLNDKAVGQSVDGCLIDDYDLAPFLGQDVKKVTFRIEGAIVCAEGELVDAKGRRHPFKTDQSWRTDQGRKPKTRKLTVEPSHGAYHRAHNGRLLTYNDEERGKSAIAKCLARIQRLRDQGIFLMRRFRRAEDILSFDPDLPRRRAERYAAPLVDRARSIIKTKAVPAHKARKFKEAIAAANEAAILLSAAEAPVSAATELYRAERDIVHLENCLALIRKKSSPLAEDLNELRLLAGSARRAHALGDWTSCQNVVRRIGELAQGVRPRLERLTKETFGELVGGLGSLDAFLEDRFAWLNARALMGNDPARWPFSVAPSSCDYIDLAGLWEFRTDPENEGERAGWHSHRPGEMRWRSLYAPRPWERQGVMAENLNSPGDCPYPLRERRCGNKPYNGFAWYRKSVFIPAAWRGKKLMLATGRIANWARIFLNGKPLGEGKRNPPSTREIPAGLLEFGRENVLAIQVYNHNNFGGITGGPLALYVEGAKPEVVVTPGPLSYVTECSYPTPDGRVRYTFFAGAMSPAVVVATNAPALELRGWEAKGCKLPSVAVFVTEEGVERESLMPPPDEEADGAALTENWILLRAEDRDTLIVLERVPRSLAWRRNRLGTMSGMVTYAAGPVRSVILVMPQGGRLDEAACRWWARALRRYPVAATEVVKAGTPQTCWIRYNYLDLGGFGNLEPLTVAPVPMLFSYGLKHNHPGLKLKGARTTAYHSEHAPYRVVENSDVVTYQAPPVDHSKVMKGVGELFAKPKAEQNARGGLSEDVMFRRMGEWGFDHLRYAWAFHARWDLPLVEYVGGPIIENNEAMWKRLDQLVDKCNAAGVQMMLCWFFNEDQPQKDVGGAVRNSSRYWKARPEAKKNAFELWRRIAARYAGRPEWAISYDFFNEPAYMNTDHWKEIMKELTAVIRSVDKKHLIVWESADGWAQPHWCLWMEPVDDPNVLYSFHHYGKHWGYAYDEYYPSYKSTTERTHIDPWLEAILFSIRHNVRIHCGEFGLSMIQPDGDGERRLNDYLAFFERFGIGWNWWNYSGRDIYRTGLAAGDRISPYVPILRKWMSRSGWGASRRAAHAAPRNR